MLVCTMSQADSVFGDDNSYSYSLYCLYCHFQVRTLQCVGTDLP